jgi:hypothetical protein
VAGPRVSVSSQNKKKIADPTPNKGDLGSPTIVAHDTGHSSALAGKPWASCSKFPTYIYYSAHETPIADRAVKGTPVVALSTVIVEANEEHSDSWSPMLDTIDKLIEPTVCSLLDGTVELALEKVFPSQKSCHSVPVQDVYVLVQPIYVWANTSQYPLTVPIDGGDVATLAAALVQRI